MRQPPSLGTSLILLVLGAAIAYGMFHAHPGDPTVVWRAMQPWQRLVIVAGFVMSAYGLGGTLNWALSSTR
jgi:hypothetical protein